MATRECQTERQVIINGVTFSCKDLTWDQIWDKAPQVKYESLAEKRLWFSSYAMMDSAITLLEELEKFQTRGFAFRGQADASWTIRSSALRWWQDERCPQSWKGVGYVDYLCQALQYSQKSEYPQLHTKCQKGNPKAWFGDHERFGYLQHYGYKTPLVDFTYDFKVALFMALRNRENHRDVSHFSLYMMDPNEKTSNEVYSFERLVHREAVSENDLREMCSFSRDGGSSGWNAFTGALIHKDGELWCPCIANERIASQKGLFIYVREERPLEQMMAGHKLWDEFQRSGIKVPDEAPGLEIKPMKCIDVPYRLADALWEVLKAEGYSEESLGLADKKRDFIAQGCFEAFVAANSK